MARGNLTDRSIMIILPKVSVDGVAKVGLAESRTLHAKIKVAALVNEHKTFPSLAENLNIVYLTKSELLSRLMYTQYINRLNIQDVEYILAHNIPSAITAYRIHQRTHIPYVIYLHDATYSAIPGTLPKFHREEIMEALNFSKAVLTNSVVTAKEFYKIYLKESTPLYPGCSPSSVINDEKEDFILFVHSVFDNFIFNILAQLLTENKQLKLTIAGSKRHTWQVVYFKYKLKFGNRVQFVFNPREEELKNLYRRAKILIHPQIENFGLAPLEAAAEGTAAIVAKGSGVLEVLKEETQVLTFSHGTDELNSILTSVTDRELRHIGTSAWKRAMEFNWNNHAKSLEKVIFQK
jgi:glycosyltransferase involved in cell wall biosynthesis